MENRQNLQTRVNYHPGARTALQSAVFYWLAYGVLNPFEHGNARDSIPRLARGKFTDISIGALATATAPAFISVKELTNKNILKSIALGISMPSFFEYLQLVGIREGVYNPLDFVAYAIGALGWGAIEYAAKGLHDSGATLRIYRALNIQHRIFDNKPITDQKDNRELIEELLAEKYL